MMMIGVSVVQIEQKLPKKTVIQDACIALHNREADPM